MSNHERRERKKHLRREKKRLESALVQLNDAHFNYKDAEMRSWCAMQMDKVRGDLRQVDAEMEAL